MIDLVSAFVFFFAVIDPIGTIPVFIAVTKDYDAGTKRRIAIRAVLVSAAVLVFFVIAVTGCQARAAQNELRKMVRFIRKVS